MCDGYGAPAGGDGRFLELNSGDGAQSCDRLGIEFHS